MNNYNPLLHHRHSIRLQGYDYSQEGVYFVTICTHNMQCLLGNITNGQMILNQFGQIIESACQQIEQQSPYIRFNIYCIMPNHFHAIIEITSPCTGGSRTARTGPPYSNRPALLYKAKHIQIEAKERRCHNIHCIIPRKDR